PQPYVVFAAEQIQQSQATTLNDFFKTRLPMNALQESQGQVNVDSGGSRSVINLRGLGENQTLVLVDGRRMPNFNNDNQGFGQGDLNGIPLAAIERIEVLPSTASGIYGGGATGGVVNVITRKNYSGGDISLAYGGSSRLDAENYRIDGS